MLESSIYIGLVNNDIFYEIFLGGPIFMIQPLTCPPPAYKTYPYWTMEHPLLNDQLQNTRKLFKTHYPITLAAFNSLVKKLSSCPEYIGSQTYSGFPVEVQVATVLWRFANSTYSFHIMQKTLSITDGSYNNFTNHFIKAMRRVGESVITWPVYDPQHAL